MRWDLNSIVNYLPFNNGRVIALCSYGNTTGVNSFSFLVMTRSTDSV